MTPPHRAVAAATALTLLAAACSGSDDSSDRTPTPASDGCPPAASSDTVTQQFDSEPPFCLDPDAEYSALVTTSAGELTFELDQSAAPLAVNNFVFLARNNYFDDTVCHRAIQDFVVQCGDPTGTGRGGPGYTFADELPAQGAYEIGSIAMANPAQPDANGSQFFIIAGDDGAALPPLYSLFGSVPDDDLGVVEDLNALGGTGDSQAPTEEIRILDVEIIEN